MSARIVWNVGVVGAGVVPRLGKGVDAAIVGDCALAASVYDGGLDDLLPRQGSSGPRDEAGGDMAVVLGRRLGGVVRMLLLSIDKLEPREQDNRKCQEVLAIARRCDLAERPSQHFVDNNADVVGGFESGGSHPNGASRRRCVGESVH